MQGMPSISSTRADQYRSPSWSPAWRASRAFSPREAWKIEIDFSGQRDRQVEEQRTLPRLPDGLQAAAGACAPLIILDAGYSAAALTAGLRGRPVHLLIRLAAGSVFYADPVTWPGKRGPPRQARVGRLARFGFVVALACGSE
jgi:DDE superfamily endonuclease